MLVTGLIFFCFSLFFSWSPQKLGLVEAALRQWRNRRGCVNQRTWLGKVIATAVVKVILVVPSGV